MGGYVVSCHGCCHDGDQYGHGKAFMYLLQCEHHAREGCMKSRGKACAGPACHKEPFLRLPPVEHSGQSLTCHRPELDGGAFSSCLLYTSRCV